MFSHANIFYSIFNRNQFGKKTELKGIDLFPNILHKEKGCFAYITTSSALAILRRLKNVRDFDVLQGDIGIEI